MNSQLVNEVRAKVKSYSGNVKLAQRHVIELASSKLKTKYNK